MYTGLMYIYENTDENKIFFLRSPQAFWLSSAPDILSTLVTSVAFYSLTPSHPDKYIYI